MEHYEIICAFQEFGQVEKLSVKSKAPTASRIQSKKQNNKTINVG